MKRAVVALVVLALLVAAGGVLAAALRLDSGRDRAGQRSAPPDPSTVPSTSPEPGATKAPRPELQRFYDQTLDWKTCGDALCSTLTVPLDYRDPGGRTIDLSVLEVPAADPDARLGSLVVNPGGPGASGTSYAAAAERVFREPVRTAYDVVGFDPRGTGHSAPVDCLDDDALDAFLAADPDPDTPDEVARHDRLQTGFWRGCEQRSGELGAHVSTVEAARDLDVLRAALGESRLTYFGASYGTKLGATYADLFPRRVGRMVLDGAVDLSIGARKLALQQAAGFETALRSYVRACLDASDSCFLGSSVDEGLRAIDDLLARVDADPLPTGGDRRLEVGNAFYGIVAPLYNRDYWYILSAALRQAMAGDGSALLALSDAYGSRGPDGYTDNSAEAFNVISCLDDPWSIPDSQVPDEEPAFERASPTFGDVFAWGLTTCRGDRAVGTVRTPRVDAAGAAPIVVIGTTRDPATPMRWAEHLAAQLDSGVLVRRDGDGHTGYNAGNSCVDDAVEGYLLDGDVPRDGLSC